MYKEFSNVWEEIKVKGRAKHLFLARKRAD